MMRNCLQNINLLPVKWIFLILFLLSGQVRASTDVNHVIVKLNGNTWATLIDSMTSDHVYTIDPETGIQRKIPLKSVYLIFNNFNRLFYISSSFQDRVAYLEDWGGTLETLDGMEYEYTSIRFNRSMKGPEMYLVLTSDSARGISLFDIYRIRADESATELSVKRGFKVSLGLFLAGTGLEILQYYVKHKDAGLLSFRTFAHLGKGTAVEALEFLPGYSFLGLNKTGVTYHSVVFGIPATTMGWVIYDTIRGRRASYFIPRSGKEPFPRSMYFFNPGRIMRTWIADKKSWIWSKIPPLPKIPFFPGK